MGSEMCIRDRYGDKRIGLLSPPYPSKSTSTPISWIYPHISYIRDKSGVQVTRLPTTPLAQNPGAPFLFDSLPIVHYVERDMREYTHPVERYKVVESVDKISAKDLIESFFRVGRSGMERIELEKIPIIVSSRHIRMESLEDLLVDTDYKNLGLVLGHPVLVISEDAEYCFFVPVGTILNTLFSGMESLSVTPLGIVFIENFHIFIPVIEIKPEDVTRLFSDVGNAVSADIKLKTLRTFRRSQYSAP
mgnify:CR=1 FL=1